MELDFYRFVINTLIAAYVFVATLWAICLPSIREDRGRGYNYFYVALASILGVFVVLFALLSLGMFPELPEADQVPNPHWTDRLVSLIWFGSFVTIGTAVLNGLSRLSLPRDEK